MKLIGVSVLLGNYLHLRLLINNFKYVIVGQRTAGAYSGSLVAQEGLDELELIDRRFVCPYLHGDCFLRHACILSTSIIICY